MSETERSGGELLRVEEVAQRIGTTPDTVRRWLRAGKLRGVRPGGSKLGWRIPASEVARVLRVEDAPKARAA